MPARLREAEGGPIFDMSIQLGSSRPGSGDLEGVSGNSSDGFKERID
jgi:hypothetical protein